MEMYDPPSPGEFINEVYLEPTGLSVDEWAQSIGVSPSMLANILQGSQDITPEVAQMLSRALGRSPESWLRLQEVYDVWQAKVATAHNIAK